jgi:hypothetical protein
MDADPSVGSPSTLPIASLIFKEALNAIKPETVNACWQNLWRKCVNDFKGFLTIDK